MNAITSSFSELGIVNKSACDSQALLELKGQYCDAKKCLDCAVGNALLKRSAAVMAAPAAEAPYQQAPHKLTIAAEP